MGILFVVFSVVIHYIVNLPSLLGVCHMIEEAVMVTVADLCHYLVLYL